MSKKTKQRIIDTTIALFNANGLANVTVKEISDELGISLGNLTYHFSKKSDLMTAIYEQLVLELRTMLAGFRSYPDFESIDNQTKLFFQFQHKYKFFYQDTVEVKRAYPAIGQQHQLHIQVQIAEHRKVLDFNVKKGLFKNKEYLDYSALAHSIWMTTALWNTQLTINGKADKEEEMVHAVWNLLIPYMTKKGFAIYKELQLSTFQLPSK